MLSPSQAGRAESEPARPWAVIAAKRDAAALPGNHFPAELRALYDNPGCDQGLVLAIPAESLPGRDLEILALDLAPLADVCGHDLRRMGLEPATSGLSSRRSTQLS